MGIRRAANIELKAHGLENLPPGTVVAFRLALALKRRRGSDALWTPIMKRAYNLLMVGK